jgi:hypothetical protein
MKITLNNLINKPESLCSVRAEAAVMPIADSGFLLEDNQMYKHGYATKSPHPLYRLWATIKNRCYNSKNKDYKRYGGRGITVCEEWECDFMSFYSWATNNGWRKGLAIDRINNNKEYSPNNCRFVRNKINAQNKSDSKWWVINGIRFESCTDAAKYFKRCHKTIMHWCYGYSILDKYHYSPKPNCYTIDKY